MLEKEPPKRLYVAIISISKKNKQVKSVYIYRKEDDLDIITGVGGGNRTRTGNTTHKILSLGRLPIPTHRHNLSLRFSR